MNSYSTLRRLYIALLVLFIVIAIGVVGFMILEGYSIQEGFYMTIITLSTVGFGEVKPLSPAGQWFTSFLIISGFGTFAYGFSLVAQALLSGELAIYIKRRRLDKTIKNLRDHVIVCGFGRNGRRAYAKLMAYGIDTVVIENDPHTIETHLAGRDILFLDGDATQDDMLQQAGVDKARSLVSTLSKDADNLFVVISARSLNSDIRLVSRASNDSTERKLRAVGVDSVVMPEAVGGAHMATLVKNPNIVEFLDHISVEGSSSINLEEVELREITQNQEHCTLNDLQIRQKTGCTVIGIKTPEGEYRINPGSDVQLGPNSKLFVLGAPEQINTLFEQLDSLSKNA